MGSDAVIARSAVAASSTRCCPVHHVPGLGERLPCLSLGIGEIGPNVHAGTVSHRPRSRWLCTSSRRPATERT